MVLPLLGLLGLGAGLAMKPAYDSWSEDRAMQGRARRAQGLPPAGPFGRGGAQPAPFQQDFRDPSGLLNAAVTPFDYNAELIRSGLLAPETLTDPYGIADLQGGYGLQQQGMSDAAAWERAVLGETGATERQRLSDAAALERTRTSGRFGLDQTLLGEGGALVRQNAGDAAAMDRLRYEIANRPVEPVQPRWDFSDPEAFTKFANQYDSQQSAMLAGEDAVDFLNQYSGLDELAPGTMDARYEIEQRLKLSALPTVAQQIMDAGAMAEDERPFFLEMAGGDFSSMWGDARAKAVFEALLDKLETMQRRQYQGAAGAGLEYLLSPPMTRREREGQPRRRRSPIVTPY